MLAVTGHLLGVLCIICVSNGLLLKLNYLSTIAVTAKLAVTARIEKIIYTYTVKMLAVTGYLLGALCIIYVLNSLLLKLNHNITIAVTANTKIPNHQTNKQLRPYEQLRPESK